MPPPDFAFKPVRIRLLRTLGTPSKRSAKIVSIVAPNGYGKTILMSELYRDSRHAGHNSFWIGLDERDATVEVVLKRIKQAIAGPDNAVHPTQALLLGDDSLQARTDQLIELLLTHDEPTYIYIDNLNSCTDEALGSFLDALIFRTPPSVRFIWSSTIGLSIDTSRAKLQGLICDVTLKDLALDLTETAELLGTELQQALGPIGLEQLQRKTEGWAAAIRMAQIVLADTEHPLATLEAFSGTDEDIVALLNRRVLNAFTPEMRHFLLCLGQLRTFTVSQCGYVTGDAHAEDRLNLLIRRNVFVIPLDRHRRTYRLHGLFRDYLIGEADRLLDPQYKQELLQRAADWCASSEEWQDAIEYALAAQAIDKASEILDRTAPTFARDRGNILQYIRWVGVLQSLGARIGLDTHFWYVWALAFHRRYNLAAQQLEQLSDRLNHRPSSIEFAPQDLPHRLDHLRICINLLSDRLPEAYDGAERWLTSQKGKDPFDVGWVHCIRGICLLTSFRFSEARQALRLAEPIMIEIGSAYALGWLSLTQGAATLYEGDCARAYRDIIAALSRARTALGDGAELCDTMTLIAAKCAIEMDLLDEARELLRRGLRTAHCHGTVGSTALGFEAAVNLWDGETDGVISISELREVARSYPPRLSLMLSCYVTQRLLVLGRLEDALIEAARIGLSPEETGHCPASTAELQIPRCRDTVAATLIDLLIATRRFKQASVRLDHESRLARKEGRFSRLVELGLAQMTVQLQCDNKLAATRELIAALRLAAPRCIVLPFKKHAKSIAILVNDTKPSSWPLTLREERDFFRRICRDLPLAGGSPLETSTDRESGSDRSFTPTKRELDILQLIDGGFSNRQIADHVDVSVGTVKWHLKNLYQKFGVSNRTAALARARALGILAR